MCIYGCLCIRRIWSSVIVAQGAEQHGWRKPPIAQGAEQNGWGQISNCLGRCTEGLEKNIKVLPIVRVRISIDSLTQDARPNCTILGSLGCNVFEIDWLGLLFRYSYLFQSLGTVVSFGTVSLLRWLVWLMCQLVFTIMLIALAPSFCYLGSLANTLNMFGSMFNRVGPARFVVWLIWHRVYGYSGWDFFPPDELRAACPLN